MTVKGGSRPACAACRFQRRRCSSDCPLALYFPANQPKVFQNVHRLYGVGNIMKILNQLTDDEQKDEAMKSIKYESYIRQIYRANGCYGFIGELHLKLVESTQQLQYVRRLIEACKMNNDVINDQVLDGSSDWATPMINDHLGFYYNGSSSDHINVSNEWDNQTKTSIELSRFAEFQELCSEGSPDHTEITCDGSFVDDQDYSFMEPKETNVFSFVSSINDTIHYPELGESKADAKLFQVEEGVHHLTMGL